MCRVIRVDRSGLAVEFQIASAGKVSSYRERKLGAERKIANRNIYVVINMGLGFCVRIPDRYPSVVYVQLGDRKILERLIGCIALRISAGRGFGLHRRIRIRTSQARKIPFASRRAQQNNLRPIEREIGHVQCFVEHQWDNLDSDIEPLGSNKRSLTERRIVGDRQIIGRNAASKNRKL